MQSSVGSANKRLKVNTSTISRCVLVELWVLITSESWEQNMRIEVFIALRWVARSYGCPLKAA